MITSFNHKGLEELFKTSKTTKLPQERLGKIKMILAAINAAEDLKDLRIPAFRLHKLKGPPFEGYMSIDVSGNYRIVFLWQEGKAWHVNYVDTH